jgi:polysaccharide biosynthesis transport protein
MDMRVNFSRSARFHVEREQSGHRSDSTILGEVDLERIMALVRRRLWIVIVSIAIGGGLAVYAVVFLLPNYTAKAVLAVSDTTLAGSGRYDDSSVDDQIAMLQSSAFLQRAFEALSRDERLKSAVPRLIDLERRLKVMQELRSRLIVMAFSAKSPNVAADVANFVARLYVEDPKLQGARGIDDLNDVWSLRVAALEHELQKAQPAAMPSRPGDDASSRPPLSERATSLRDQIDAMKVDRALARRRQENQQEMLAMSPPIRLVALAVPPERPSSISRNLIAVPALAASAIFGLFLAFLLGRLDKRIYIASELKAVLAVPCIAAVPAQRRRIGALSARARNSSSRGYVRAIDDMVTTMLLMPQTDLQTILITSSTGEEEGLEFAFGVASPPPRLHRQVLLIDIDTTHRPPGWRRWRATNKRLGIFDVLAETCSSSAAIERLPSSRFDYLPNPAAADDPLALIVSGRLRKLIHQLRQQYDWIILKGPPVVGVSETRLIAAIADVAVLVVRSGVATYPNVAEAVDILSSSMSVNPTAIGSPWVATVVTDAPRSSLPARFRDRTTVRQERDAARPAGTAAPAKSEDQPIGADEPTPSDAAINQSVP